MLSSPSPTRATSTGRLRTTRRIDRAIVGNALANGRTRAVQGRKLRRASRYPTYSAAPAAIRLARLAEPDRSCRRNAASPHLHWSSVPTSPRDSIGHGIEPTAQLQLRQRPKVLRVLSRRIVARSVVTSRAEGSGRKGVTTGRRESQSPVSARFSGVDLNRRHGRTWVWKARSPMTQIVRPGREPPPGHQPIKWVAGDANRVGTRRTYVLSATRHTTSQAAQRQSASPLRLPQERFRSEGHLQSRRTSPRFAVQVEPPPRPSRSGGAASGDPAATLCWRSATLYGIDPVALSRHTFAELLPLLAQPDRFDRTEAKVAKSDSRQDLKAV